MKLHNVEQRSDEWYSIRLGKPTASNFHRILSPTGKKSEQAEKYMDELIAEIVRGKKFEKFEPTISMYRGRTMEEEALDQYAKETGADVKLAGFITDDFEEVGCSPDALIGEDGGVEIKVYNPDNHIAVMRSRKLEQKHRPQTQGCLWLTGRKWWDTVCHNDGMKQVVMRSERDEEYIKLLSDSISEFLLDMKREIQSLKSQGYI